MQRQRAKPGSPRLASNPPEELILDDQIDGDPRAIAALNATTARPPPQR